MSVVDSVFLAVSGAPQEIGDWLVEGAGAEVLVTEAETVRLRMHGEIEHDWFGVVVQPNGYVAPEPEPDEVQAMDRYPIEVQVRGGSSDEVLHRVARRLFDTLVTARPDVPALLVHNLDTLVSAHLPGVATHSFDPPITPDVEDIDTWRPWVV
ncbi:hypothetical protein [Kribbella shirazensis]|uniref:Uncharacterized protein n=1 Tax=Kribbella shirazensis TaxID=1105143 RepID=A0A7X6A1I7_9ACTN|nr:hypothetical protein [Kribbella shirazensis]NIK58292.1 hypothetical protein [Kribbella shirazensis]